jgi:hypothetical protein
MAGFEGPPHGPSAPSGVHADDGGSDTIARRALVSRPKASAAEVYSAPSGEAGSSSASSKRKGSRAPRAKRSSGTCSDGESDGDSGDDDDDDDDDDDADANGGTSSCASGARAGVGGAQGRGSHCPSVAMLNAVPLRPWIPFPDSKRRKMSAKATAAEASSRREQRSFAECPTAPPAAPPPAPPAPPAPLQAESPSKAHPVAPASAPPSRGTDSLLAAAEKVVSLVAASAPGESEIFNGLIALVPLDGDLEGWVEQKRKTSGTGQRYSVLKGPNGETCRSHVEARRIVAAGTQPKKSAPPPRAAPPSCSIPTPSRSKTLPAPVAKPPHRAPPPQAALRTDGGAGHTLKQPRSRAEEQKQLEAALFASRAATSQRAATSWADEGSDQGSDGGGGTEASLVGASSVNRKRGPRRKRVVRSGASQSLEDVLEGKHPSQWVGSQPSRAQRASAAASGWAIAAASGAIADEQEMLRQALRASVSDERDRRTRMRDAGRS